MFARISYQGVQCLLSGRYARTRQCSCKKIVSTSLRESRRGISMPRGLEGFGVLGVFCGACRAGLFDFLCTSRQRTSALVPLPLDYPPIANGHLLVNRRSPCSHDLRPLDARRDQKCFACKRGCHRPKKNFDHLQELQAGDSAGFANMRSAGTKPRLS